MSKFLVFQVCTNLGSFGSENAVWYYRVSDAYPQISQVVGLLAASLGLSRDDLRLQSFYEDYKIIEISEYICHNKCALADYQCGV